MGKANKNHRYTPIYIALAVIAGILIGSMFSHRFTGNRLNIVNTTSNKLNTLMCYIEEEYVDTVDLNRIVEQTIPLILDELDPHSTYISADAAAYENDELKKSFSGIGVQFTIDNDTVYFTKILKGGPAEKVGLMDGDRLVSVDGKSYVGKNRVSNKETIHLLKGEKGTKVKLGVVRNGDKTPIYFEVERGDIPVTSINTVYMLDDKVGYMKIDRFGEETCNELITALARLEASSFKGLVIDLRGNGGGSLNTAVKVINEFLPNGRLITYTEGLRMPRDERYSDGKGSYQKMPLVLLVNETSASASEIFAGAIQDNDRGMIVGRRTFGKGLVQDPIDLGDGSIMNLTVARYYTPSGRCVQKPYKPGGDADYSYELIKRFKQGEFFNEDSIKQHGKVYKTRIGRNVYGGGGIMPDIFVPEDTTQYTTYYSEIFNKNLIAQFAFDYTDKNRETLVKLGSGDAIDAYLRRNHVIEQFIRYCDKQGVKRRNNMIFKSQKLIEKELFGGIIYNSIDEQECVKYINKDDKTLAKALELFKSGNTVPRLESEVQNKLKNSAVKSIKTAATKKIK